MDSLHYGALSAEKAAHLIREAIAVLESAGIAQKRIQLDIEFGYLTQAKNLEKYGGKDPFYCYGYDRRDLLRRVVEQYGLVYEREVDTFFYPKVKEQRKDPGRYWYVFYYYHPEHRRLGYGLAMFSPPSAVRLTLFGLNRNQRSAVWVGKYERSNSYLILDLYDEATKQLRELHTYAAGPLRSWENCYLGTFSGLMIESAPIAGRCVLEKVESKEVGLVLIEEEKKHPLIEASLRKTSVTVNPVTPPSIEELFPQLPYEFLVGTYNFVYQDGKDLKRGTLDLNLSMEAALALESGTQYIGYFKLVESQSLEVHIRRLGNRGKRVGSRVVFLVKVQRTEPENRVYSGVVIGRNATHDPKAYPALLYANEVFSSEQREIASQFVSNYFGGYEMNIQARDYHHMRQLLDGNRN